MRLLRFAPILAITTLLLSGCSIFSPRPKVETRTEIYETIPNALSVEYFHSRQGDVVGRYPQGWLQVNIENDPELENIHFVYTDARRENALVLTELPMTAELRRLVERDGLIALTEESFRRKRAKSETGLAISRQPTIFTVSDRLYASYEYQSNDAAGGRRSHRVVTFTTGNKFYELAIVQLATQSPGKEIENFRLLQSVIGVLEGVARVNGA